MCLYADAGEFGSRTRHVGLLGDFDGPLPARTLHCRLVLRVDLLLTSHSSYRVLVESEEGRPWRVEELDEAAEAACGRGGTGAGAAGVV